MCAFRTAFAQLAEVPVAAVQIVGVKSAAGGSFAVLVSQLDGACAEVRRLSAAAAKGDRRAQSLAPVAVDVSVDVSRTALTAVAVNAEAVVRSAIEVAFVQNPSLIDALFSSVTAAACAAQGVAPNVCPNPPSAVLAMPANPAASAPWEGIGALVPAIAGAVGGGVFAAAVLGVLWRRRQKKLRATAPDNAPPGVVTIRQVVPAPAANDFPAAAHYDARFAGPPLHPQRI